MKPKNLETRWTPLMSKSDTKGVNSHWCTFLYWPFMGDFSLTMVHVKLMIYDSGDTSEMSQYMRINKQFLSRLIQEQTGQTFLFA